MAFVNQQGQLQFPFILKPDGTLDPEAVQRNFQDLQAQLNTAMAALNLFKQDFDNA
jgi:hypothetical protein